LDKKSKKEKKHKKDKKEKKAKKEKHIGVAIETTAGEDVDVVMKDGMKSLDVTVGHPSMGAHGQPMHDNLGNSYLNHALPLHYNPHPLAYHQPYPYHNSYGMPFTYLESNEDPVVSSGAMMNAAADTELYHYPDTEHYFIDQVHYKHPSEEEDKKSEDKTESTSASSSGDEKKSNQPLLHHLLM